MKLQAQESISRLINVDALLGKLGDGSAVQAKVQPVPEEQEATSSLIPLPIQWPRQVLSTKLCERLPQATYLDQLRSSLRAGLQSGSATDLHDRLNTILKLLVDDVSSCRDQLLSLDNQRRALIQRRLEFIARKIARGRGEKWTRSLSLTDILKDSYRDDANAQNKIGVLAWKAFAAEVALYHVLELFFLKCLDVYGWRKFELVDLTRMNYAIHTFLSQRASGFAYDKHCWNFVRRNVYSWYVPTQTATAKLARSVDGLNFSWSDLDLVPWIEAMPPSLGLTHLNFAEDARVSKLVLELLEDRLAMPLTTTFQGRPVCKKFFFPALELGGVALSVMDRLLGSLRRFQSSNPAASASLSDEGLQLHRALWGCEFESFEAFWTEVLALLKVVRTARSYSDWSVTDHYGTPNVLALNRLPHAMHVVNMLGLELHNLEQLPLGGSGMSKVQEGSAGQIQQIEAFDAAVVMDHPDRVRSARWMKAVAEEYPYWRSLVSAGTNLNWGETHLFLALSKLKENGCCVYLSHRMLPDGGDGDKLRRAILAMARFEYFLELPEDRGGPYRYVYVFTRSANKTQRDQHRPRFGQLAAATELNLGSLEEANSTQAEIGERGWDHLFVRGAAPLIRHLNHKFPKLFQLATVQTCDGEESLGLFSSLGAGALEITASATGSGGTGLCFVPVADRGQAVRRPEQKRDRWFVFPHNGIDLPWIQCLLNSPPAQFWIRHELLSAQPAGKTPKLQELRNCPIVDLSRTPSESVHEMLDWLGSAKPDLAQLRKWALDPRTPALERHVRYMALSRRYSMLERVVLRYKPLFTTCSLEEFTPEAVHQFYPSSLLAPLTQCPDIRIHYVGRERCTVMPENWTVEDLHSVSQATGGKNVAYTIIHTRQGPTIQILMPATIREYVNSQLASLREHSWAEVVALLRVPRDIPMFTAQSNEIRRVVADTAQELKTFQTALEEVSLELFEISAEVRQFLPH